MAGEAEQLVVSLEARIRDFERNFQKANRTANDNFRSIEQRARTAGKNLESAMGNSTSAMSRQLDNFGTAAAGKLKMAFGAIAAGVSLNELRKAADTYTGIMNSLKVAGVKDNALPQTFDALFASAQRNAVPLDALAQLFGRVSQAQTTLKASSQDVMRVTDIVAQSLRVSGKSASESSGALLQLAQAFSNGKVQAEEYNSLLDGAYPLLQAAAAGLKEAGGDVAKLTALVKDGKVSSEAFFRAIEAGAPLLEEKLSGAALTTGQALQLLQNEFVKTVGEFDRATGASQALAGAISGLAGSIGGIGTAAAGAVNGVQALIAKVGELAAANAGVQRQQALLYQNERSARTDAAREMALGNSGGRDKLAQERTAADAAAQAASRQAVSGFRATEIDFANRQVTAPLPPTRPAGTRSNIRPVSLKDHAVPGEEGKGGGGGGSSAGKLDSYERELAKIQKRTEALREEAKTVGRSTYEIEKSKVALQLEQAARQAGIPVTDQLRSSIDNAAEGYANARAEVEKLKQAQEGLKTAGTFAGNQIADSLIDVVVEGKSASEAIQSLAKSFAKAALQAALMGSGPFGALFGGGSGGGGGLFGILAKGIFGFAEGGYTGSGAKHEPAGIVHKGEYVLSKAAVSRLGVANLNRLHEGALKGFADGGLVGAAPIAAPALPAAGVGNVQNMNAVNQSVTVNVQGGSSGSQKQDAAFADAIGKRVKQELHAMIGAELRQSIRPGGLLREANR